MRDNTNDLIGFKYNDSIYYYIKNVQNDIIGILDSNYNVVAKYKYNSWGVNIKIIDEFDNDVSDNLNHIANINPFRYRSYYYDSETKLYYLNSRYYNPLWGRFLNSDGTIGANNDVLGYNLYTYCSNNFINNVDFKGNVSVSIIVNNIINKASNIIQNVVDNSSNTNTNTNTNTSQAVSKAKSKNKGPTNGHNNLPKYGPPNTSMQKPNGDWRTYGPDGKAVTDRDYSHPNDHPDLPNPHAHDWTWDGENASRGPAYDPSIKNIANIVLAAGTGYLIYRGLRMLPSLIPSFWWTIPINATAP